MQTTLENPRLTHMVEEENELELVWERLSQGDMTAFKEILERCSLALSRYQVKWVKSKEIADEMLLDSFSAVLGKRGTLNGIELRDFFLLVIRERIKKEMKELRYEWDAKPDKENIDFYKWAESRKPNTGGLKKLS